MTADKFSAVRSYFHFSKEIDEDSLFKKMITVSLILHFMVFIFFGLKATLFSTEPIELDPTIKVTMVGLPDKIAQLPEKAVEKPQPPPPAPVPAPVEKAPPPEVAKPVAKPQPKPVVVLHPKVDTRKALEKIKEIEKEDRRKSALAAIQNEVQAEEAEKKKVERQAKVAQILKGNAINNGSALHGLMKADFDDYAGNVQSHIHDHWNLPEWLSNDNLKATIVVYIDSQGNVVKRVVRKPSGDERFDNFALKAVDESSPFPRPPEKLVDVLRNDGMAIGFPQ